MPPETLSHRESHHSRHHIQSNHAPIVALACWHLNQPMKSCTNHCNTMQSNQSNTTNGSIQSCLDQIDTINNERERPSVISLYYLHIRDIAFSSRNRKSEKPYRDTEAILKTLRKASSCHLFCSLLVHRHTLSRSRVPSPPASLLTALINRSIPSIVALTRTSYRDPIGRVFLHLPWLLVQPPRARHSSISIPNAHVDTSGLLDDSIARL